MRYQRPKGTADILPGQSEAWHFVEETARLLFGDYRYNEIRTPLFESFDVFARSAGDTSDVVTKEMYDFHDKGDRHIALRPEGTAGVVRAYVENKLYGPEFAKPYKAFYIGPMFRYERPQSGRQRQFHQVGVEAFGSDSPALDVEVIAMATQFFETLGLTGLRVAINSLGDAESRENYRQALIDYLKPHYDELSDDSKERLEKNPLRVLDSKDPKDQQFVADAPSILDYLTEPAQAHFTEVKALLTELKIDFEIDETMVRGLDYYNHTIFEIMVESEAFGKGYTTVCGGGRYSGLVKEFGGPADVSGVGFGIGLERLILLLDSEGIEMPTANDLDVYVVGIGDETSHEALKLVQAIRGFGFSADRDFLDRKPKAQFKSADREKASFVMTLGQNELDAGTVNFKSMVTGKEDTIKLSDIYEDFPQIYDQHFEE